MQKYTQEQLKEILAKHAKWLADEEGGKRAYLRGADLCRANLRGADLSGAVAEKHGNTPLEARYTLSIDYLLAIANSNRVAESPSN